MTHEEAVKNLDTMWKMLTRAYDEIPDSFVVAFTKAIDALKAETDGDTISRQAAITEFSCCELTPDGGIDANYAIELLKQLPSAQPKVVRCKDCNHWMPYDWMFSEVRKSQNINDYSEDELGCAYCGMAMHADDFCSRAERRIE